MRLAAVLLLFKEEAFVEACVRAVYPVVDSICCVTRHDRNLNGREIVPDHTIERLLKIPDPENKIRLVVRRELEGQPGRDGAARLRNAALALDPDADYYLVVDSDEIWPRETLQKCWDEVQRTRHAGYRISSLTYFRKWNHRIVEPGHGYRPFVFLRRGFRFDEDRQINWRGPARWKEYLRTGRKPKTVYFPPEWRLHHGSCVGDDARISTKPQNYSHAAGVDPTWFDRVWKNFDPGVRNFHYFADRPHLYESLVTTPTSQLPVEITRCAWPEGWIDEPSSPPTA
jgi:hypothetical protein